LRFAGFLRATDRPCLAAAATLSIVKPAPRIWIAALSLALGLVARLAAAIL
jgi:hypothetical protein